MKESSKRFYDELGIPEEERWKPIEERRPTNAELGVGELQYDEEGNPFRMINGQKIIQMKTDTEEKRKHQMAMNRHRALLGSNPTPGERREAWRKIALGY